MLEGRSHTGLYGAHRAGSTSAPSGVLVVDKPSGPTSHDVVSRIRRALRIRAVGHAGTLDPLATGVMIIAVGEATKLVPWLSAHDKAYLATIALGEETDTLDVQGSVTRRLAVDPSVLEALAASSAGAPATRIADAFDRERARETQVPPAYSAIKVDGRRSFAEARRGRVRALAPRPVRLHRIALLGCTADPPTLQIAVGVSKGYYVRALARDLAESLGTVGHLTRLRRTSSGCFGIEEAVTLDAPAEVLRARLEPAARAAARTLPVVRLDEAGTVDARHGKRVAPDRLRGQPAEACVWLGPDGELVAIGRIHEDGSGTVVRGFREATSSSDRP
ncbi:MAG TPA: tRNA pseudouridine(55) synthase TruB [Polyangiaceae bacterium]|nr:tRNA pseudouridine(55) synthase TruB [Polyangiaceae bacterium]